MFAAGLRVVGLIACITFFVFKTAGQELADTTWLAPVEVSGMQISTYSIGSRTQRVDSLQLARFATTSLAAALQGSQAIYFREYGPGMLSSISLRGTATHHTALLWNGLPVNYPSLGVADYSVVPAFFIDDAEVFYGGVAALAGSGAIGGAVALDDKLLPDTKGLSLTQEAGSFGTWFSGAKAQYSGAKMRVAMAAFYKLSENNFRFKNRAKAGSPWERQVHGAFDARGLKTALFLTPWKKGEFLLSSWATSYNREIIPPYTVPGGHDRQQDRSVRMSLAYKHQIRSGRKWDTTIGRIDDVIRFNGLASNTTQYMWSGNWEGRLKPWWQARVGYMLTHIAADVPEYGSRTDENRGDMYAFFNFFPTEKWEISINNRYGFVQNFAVPFTPSVGLAYAIMSTKATRLDWRGRLSKSYRTPTLNDRYWKPGGNPDLLAEEGWNAESGLDWFRGGQTHEWSAALSAFVHRIENWILWLPEGSIWTPQNVRNVLSRGVELGFNHKVKFTRGELMNRLNYSLTLARVQRGYTGDEGNIGNQLPYLPTQQASWNASFENPHVRLSASALYYGRRFTLIDNDKSLTGYTLFDVGIGHGFSVGQSDFSGRISIQNLLNTPYENLEYRPMPGRSFHLQLSYTFKQKK